MSNANVRVAPIRGTAAAMTRNNVVLLAGEVGYETDTGKTKRGDGITAWNALPYDLDATSVAATTPTLWKPSTAYAAGQPVVNPAGFVVTALAGFTSGASYNAANWSDPVAATYSTQDDAAGLALLAGLGVF